MQGANWNYDSDLEDKKQSSKSKQGKQGTGRTIDSNSQQRNSTANAK
jgi:hypothetical protein